MVEGDTERRPANGYDQGRSQASGAKRHGWFLRRCGRECKPQVLERLELVGKRRARVRAVSPDRTAVRKVSDTFGNAGDDGAPQGVRHLGGHVRDRALAPRRAEAVPEAPAVAAARAPDLTNSLAASFHS